MPRFWRLYRWGEDTLHDHDRPVDDDAEVDGSEAHQVGRDAEQPHEDEGEEHRERDDRRHDQSGADVAQEENQDEEDDDRPFDQVADHGRDVAVDELRAVQIGADGDPFGQHLLDFGHPILQLPGHHVGVGALEHHGDAADAFALAVACHGAEALGRPELHGGHVADVDRDAAAVGHDDLADVVERRDHAFRADVVGAVHLFDVAAARVLVVAAQGLEDVADGDVERVERIGIDRHLILLEVAAEAVDLDDSGDSRQLPLDDPVLDRAQLHRVVAILVAGRDVERILVDLAQTRGDGHHLGRSQLRGNLSGDGLYLLVDELPGVEDRDTLLEYDGDDREAETRDGADLHDVHDVAHRHLDREGDELLDLLRRERGRNGHDLHLVVGDVRHGIDRQGQHRVDAARQQEERGQTDEELFCDRKADYVLKHGVLRALVSCKDSGRSGSPCGENAEVSDMRDERAGWSDELPAGGRCPCRCGIGSLSLPSEDREWLPADREQQPKERGRSSGCEGALWRSVRRRAAAARGGANGRQPVRNL